jgi:hypothetical protein
MTNLEEIRYAIHEAIQVMEQYNTGEDFALVSSLRRMHELEQKLQQHGVMQGLQLNLPSMGEVSDAIEMLAKKSTAPDAETPDWLKADIRNGINWALNYVTKHNTSPTVGQRSVGTVAARGHIHKWHKTSAKEMICYMCKETKITDAGSSYEGQP